MGNTPSYATPGAGAVEKSGHAEWPKSLNHRGTETQSRHEAVFRIQYSAFSVSLCLCG
jgi:hypothetical protein